jgi:hypothetical protein
MTDPFPVPAPTATPPTATGGLRISFSGKTGGGYEAGLLNISGTEEEVAAFLRVDRTTPEYKASPFGTLVARWNQGHVWAQGDYKKASGKA